MVKHSSRITTHDRLTHMLAGLIILISIGFSLFVVADKVWIDDAFISFRYGRNFAAGKGLVFNVGERVEGYTNFLWVVITSVSQFVGIHPIRFAQALSVVAQALTLVSLYALGLKADRPRWQALLAPLLLSFSAPFVIYPMTGMETSFLTMLVIAGVLFFRLKAENYGGGGTTGVLLAIVLTSIALTRFDGIVLAGSFLAFGIATAVKQDRRSWLRIAGAVGFILLLYHIWRLNYYGELLPNTAYAKVGFGLASMVGGTQYLYRFVIQIGLPFFPLAIGLYAVGGITPTHRLAGWLLLIQSAYVILVGGDWMMLFRFLLPALPLLFFLTEEAVWETYRMAQLIINTSLWRMFAGFTVLVFLWLASLVPLKNSLFIDERQQVRFYYEIAQDSFRPRDAEQIARFLNSNLPIEYVVASEFAGIMAYEMTQNVLDTFGLVDYDIPRQSFPKSNFGSSITVEYLVRRSPDLIVPCARLFRLGHMSASLYFHDFTSR